MPDRLTLYISDETSWYLTRAYELAGLESMSATIALALLEYVQRHEKTPVSIEAEMEALRRQVEKVRRLTEGGGDERTR